MEIIKLTLISIVWYLNLSSISAGQMMEKSLKATNCSCGQSASLKARIIGGEIAAENEFPWQCAIFARKKTICGGSLISDRYVLSAAHCFEYQNPMSKQTETRDISTITIVVGKIFLDDPEAKKIRMSELFVHPLFESTTFEADIAICKLIEPIPEFNKFIVPICLPPEGNSFTNYESIVTGFGRTTTARVVRRLRKVVLKVLHDETCVTKVGKKIHYNANTMMCAALPGHDSCKGDSGGPLISELKRKTFYQIGIVSFGIGCGNYNYPGVYTRVNKFIDWILLKTKDGIFCDE